ncbi:Glycosyltransferase involved in cell wall bisynthesis [Clostridium amylolyticum]|uniref:Glycosyltransferase involved in cell wall bisynthesis n=1 Tax=Clostridium amylolyticum TaxID=1121298 RepID=A0A1M6MB08_9CLOT|nr:glycosyltransferase family A protein [Clostridium amylolyticum]SHJ80652.1 Glycosyltransferase involved in cell wall bisynthesis [Clostridium amylolyticum]
MPLVSIVIPVYNLENYISMTLESIESQSFKDYEIILVDDGSKDNSCMKIESFFIGKNINYTLIKRTNGGVSRARNIGLNTSTGKYVLFIDGDDSLEATALEKMVKKIEEHKADICHCGYYEFQENSGKVTYRYSNNKSYIQEPLPGPMALEKKLKKEIWVCTGNALYNKKMLLENQLQYSEGFSYGEDAEFIGKCLYNSKIVTGVSEDLTKLMVRKTSAMNTAFSEKYCDALKANRRLWDYISSVHLNGQAMPKENLKLLLDYDYINIYLSIAKWIYDEYGIFEVFKANKKFNKLSLNLYYADVENVLSNIKNLKTFEVKVFLTSKFLYFYLCKVFKRLRG